MDVSAEGIHEHIMVQGIEVLGQVDVDGPGVSLVVIVQKLGHGLMGTPPRPESETGFREYGFVNRCEDLGYGLLDRTVQYGGHSEVPLSPIRFWYSDATYRRREVPSRPQLVVYPVPILLDEPGQFGDGHPVHTWRTLVRHDLTDRLIEVLACEDLVHKVGYVQLAPCFAYGEVNTVFGHLDFHSFGLEVVSQSFTLTRHPSSRFHPRRVVDQRSALPRAPSLALFGGTMASADFSLSPRTSLCAVTFLGAGQ